MYNGLTPPEDLPSGTGLGLAGEYQKVNPQCNGVWFI